MLALKRVANALIAWTHKCSDRALALSRSVEKEEYRNNLKKLSEALLRVPENAPETFYESILCIYLCFSADPDSVGTLDRYLYPFYKRDMENGSLSKEQAKEYLQELFLMLQAATPATSDGRYNGDMLKFGLGQSEGRDREGLSALLNSIAKVDPNGIGCGSTVTNITLDGQLIKNDDNFEKTVDLLLTYFQNGGVHFQLTYVSKDDLMCAKETPDEHKHLRVRVTGFSDYFVKLNEAIQDDIIARTEQK